MAGMNPEVLEMLMHMREEGKGGGGEQRQDRRDDRRDYGRMLYPGDSQGPGGTGLDPQTEFDLGQNNLRAASHFANLSGGPGTEGSSSVGAIQTGMANAFAGNRRAARAEAYNNRFRETEQKLKLMDLAEKSGYRVGPGGQLEREESGFEAGYKSNIPATPESGFNPQGEF
jgi:hypothetical protein